MAKYEWKKGDVLEVINDNNNTDLDGVKKVIANNDICTNDDSCWDVDILVNDVIRHGFLTYRFRKLVNGKPIKQIPDDLVRYMVFGFGCNNKGDLRKTEKELREDLEKHSKESSWSGKVIGYKLVPLFEAEEKTIIKSITKVAPRRIAKKK